MPTILNRTPLDPVRHALAMQHVFLSSSTPFDLLADQMCPQKNFLLNLSAKIPLDLKKKTFFQILQTEELFPLNEPIAAHCFLRGIEPNELFNRSLHNLPVSNSAELLSTYFREQFGSQMFVSTSSWDEKFTGRLADESFDRVALLSALINDTKFSSDLFEQLEKDLKKTPWKTLSKRWHENEFDEQRFDELINDVQTLNEQLHHQYDLI